MIRIGIDTGDHTGVAVWDTERRMFLQIETATLPAAFDIVAFWVSIRGQQGVEVVIEDARLRKWIPRYGDISRTIGRAQGAGSVKRDAKIWQQFCELRGLRLTSKAPTKGLTKWDAAAFSRITGWNGRTSEHARDAALLVWMR